MTNSADPDQLASEEANWSGSTLFAKAGYIRIQQDKGSAHIQPFSIWTAAQACNLCMMSCILSVRSVTIAATIQPQSLPHCQIISYMQELAAIPLETHAMSETRLLE